MPKKKKKRSRRALSGLEVCDSHVVARVHWLVARVHWLVRYTCNELSKQMQYSDSNPFVTRKQCVRALPMNMSSYFCILILNALNQNRA